MSAYAILERPANTVNQPRLGPIRFGRLVEIFRVKIPLRFLCSSFSHCHRRTGGQRTDLFETSEWLYILGVQALGVAVIAVVVGILGYILFSILNKADLLRVSRDAELYGLDIAIHKTYAYPEDMMDEN